MTISPFALPGRFYKGNLHCHSTVSDGRFDMAEVVRKYRLEGYDFLAISDHFQEQYGYPVADTRPFRTANFTTLLGAELHQGRLGNGELWHILAVGLPHDFAAPSPDEDAKSICARAAAAGAFLGFAHPGWYCLTPDDTRKLPMVHAVEIYNHGSEVSLARGDGWPLADMLLTEGRRVTAFAADDMHRMSVDFAGGWVHVKAESLEPENLLASLKAGNFYSSMGPLLHDIRIEGDEIVVECSPAAVITAGGTAARRAAEMGIGLTGARFPRAKFDGGFFRITVVDDRGRKAWSNPVWLDV
ncbi:hypothetical protein SAMN05216456_3559 [Devosia crocina]|uniref:Polymerase/histidinol phosphatase N-terminal domain-containing protein n=1 Tax=Devosia crocina TaxID=429728 RepID=A0A1I7NVK6_9HYPH|nr:CehA/McbA family metallohydrolase [Devosia crocina]SFV38680.1 hypothetical protein SAMN05216456_3559 [Devosia crocina]